MSGRLQKWEKETIMAKKRTIDPRREWPTGVLTEEVIRKDARIGNFTAPIVFTVAFVVLCCGMIPWLKVATTITLRIAAMIVCGVFLAVYAYKGWKKAVTKVELRIEEDTLKEAKVRTEGNRIGARLSDAANRTPVLIFEKHGEYVINPEQIHEYYIALELVHQFKEGEKVYMVYDKATNELLRLYRKKYWKLPEQKEKTE